VRDPVHAARLVLLLALATLWALSLGSRVLKSGRRRYLETRRRRGLSVFQLGLRWLKYALQHDQPIPGRLYLYPP
jgi:hypothetical protein